MAGPGIANPIGAFRTGAMMPEGLGEGVAAQRLMQAIAAIGQAGPLTPDLGGQADTRAVTAAVIAAITP
jgi:isocitrate/isopropylmalate dehydrogenase